MLALYKSEFLLNGSVSEDLLHITRGHAVA
jgi:hypothetical protein